MFDDKNTIHDSRTIATSPNPHSNEYPNKVLWQYSALTHYTIIYHA